MKVNIDKNDSLPEGEYELTDRTKLENARMNIPPPASDRRVLMEYDRIAGRVVKDGAVLPPQSLWKQEQQHMNKPIGEFTDDELQSVIRRAENTNLSEGLYQRASNEWRLRQDKRLLKAASREKWHSGHVPVGYPKICRTEQIGDVIQDLTEEKHSKLQGGKSNPIWEKVVDDLIESGRAELEQRRETHRWYEKPLGMIAIGIVIGLVGGLGVAYLAHRFGWV